MEILVVCTGNTCRSPLVAAWLSDELAPEATVASAGLLGWSDQPATPHSVTVARERGLSLADHRSRRLETAMVTAADLVLAMTRDHAWAIAARDAAAAERTFLLPELVRRGHIAGPRGGRPVNEWVIACGAERDHLRPGRPTDEIADPAGQPLAAYVELADRIGPLVVDLARLLG